MAGAVVTSYVLPSLGVVLSISLYASSLPTVLRARRTRDLRSLDAPTLCLQTVTSASWALYGVTIGDPFVWGSNIPGWLFTLVYVSTLLQLCGDPREGALRRRVEGILFAGVVLLVSVITTVAFLVRSPTARGLIAGLTANTLCALMFLAPTLNVAKAIRERNAAAFVPPLVLVTLLNCAMWFGYGLFAAHDPLIYVPNGVGLVTSVIQGALLLVLPRRPAPAPALREHLDLERHHLAAADREAKTPSPVFEAPITIAVPVDALFPAAAAAAGGPQTPPDQDSPLPLHEPDDSDHLPLV